MALHEVARGHGTAFGGARGHGSTTWRRDMALHVVERGHGTACGGEGTRHCMRWRGDMALHEVESQNTARAVFPGPYMGFRYT